MRDAQSGGALAMMMDGYVPLLRLTRFLMLRLTALGAVQQLGFLWAYCELAYSDDSLL